MTETTNGSTLSNLVGAIPLLSLLIMFVQVKGGGLAKVDAFNISYMRHDSRSPEVKAKKKKGKKEKRGLHGDV